MIIIHNNIIENIIVNYNNIHNSNTNSNILNDNNSNNINDNNSNILNNNIHNNTNNNINDNTINAYLCLKYPPKVYQCDDHMYLSTCYKYADVSLLAAACWSRCSQREIGWYEQRSDMRV
ncbi:hypothetical protein EHP00_2170 [Ecytonucleospora hepatopenaei]|uniref:Uncharacterized protein n=1 Tax=Ecytonucleospora hepatopenaei TaxID=646526 RepID=A0A1W0E5B8_9MICR|nr:hypothetical protein EHP00_2170 [Ecytonucleospora hepatopenaei]